MTEIEMLIVTLWVVALFFAAVAGFRAGRFGS